MAARKTTRLAEFCTKKSIQPHAFFVDVLAKFIEWKQLHFVRRCLLDLELAICQRSFHSSFYYWHEFPVSDFAARKVTFVLHEIQNALRAIGKATVNAVALLPMFWPFVICRFHVEILSFLLRSNWNFAWDRKSCFSYDLFTACVSLLKF